MEGYTASELATLLNLPLKTVQMRLRAKGIKPLSHECVYPSESLELIKGVAMGRPRKKPGENSPPQQ
jgi:hypothetical protein